MQDVAPEATGRGDDPVMVLVEQIPIDLGLAVIPLHEGPAGELDEVLVADVVLGEQGQVVVGLLAALGLSPGVVDPAASQRQALESVVVGHVGLDADDRLDTGCSRGLVERQDPVHVAVVGDADGRLAVGGRGRHDVVDPGGAIEHRVLGVDVEVGEARVVAQ